MAIKAPNTSNDNAAGKMTRAPPSERAPAAGTGGDSSLSSTGIKKLVWKAYIFITLTTCRIFFEVFINFICLQQCPTAGKRPFWFLGFQPRCLSASDSKSPASHTRKRVHYHAISALAIAYGRYGQFNSILYPGGVFCLSQLYEFWIATWCFGPDPYFWNLKYCGPIALSLNSVRHFKSSHQKNMKWNMSFFIYNWPAV